MGTKVPMTHVALAEIKALVEKLLAIVAPKAPKDKEVKK